jgi:hypothetical protein
MLKRIIITIFAAALFPLFLAWGAGEASSNVKPGKEAHAPGDKKAMKDSTRAGGQAKGKETEAAAAMKMDTLTGEVVDIQCVMRDGQAKAADTAKAASPVAATAAGTSAPEGAAIAAKPNEAKDKGWNSCGTEAVRRGAPVGIRSKDSKQIVLVAMDNRQPPGRAFGKQIGKTVSVVGRRYNQGGLDVFEVAKVMPSAGEERRAAGKND